MTARASRRAAAGGSTMIGRVLIGSVVAAAVVGCAGPGSAPGPEPDADQDPAVEYVRLLEECDIVAEDRIAAIVGADSVLRRFHGAVCRWAAPTAGGDATVTLNWFERGTLRTEKSVAERLGYRVDNEKIGGAVVYVMRDPDDPLVCGATVRAPVAGVVGWWVNGVDDPCTAARALAEVTLSHSY